MVLCEVVYFGYYVVVQNLFMGDVFVVVDFYVFDVVGDGVGFLLFKVQFVVFVVVQQFVVFEGLFVFLCVERFGYDKGVEVQYFFELFGVQVEQGVDFVGVVFDVLDVCGRGCEVDVIYVVVVYFVGGYFDVVVFVDFIFVLLVFVFVVGVFVVFDWFKDVFVEQIFVFGFQGVVVDGFRFFDFVE